MASSLFKNQHPQPMNQQNNTLQTLMDAMRTGKRPQDVLPQLAKQDPAVAQAMQIISGNTPQAVTGIIQQMAAKNGITIPALMARMGLK